MNIAAGEGFKCGSKCARKAATMLHGPDILGLYRASVTAGRITAA